MRFSWPASSGAAGPTRPTRATLIGNIFTHEVSGNILLPGDSFGASGQNELDLSYFAPSYYRAFAGVDSGHNWMGVLDGTLRAPADGVGELRLGPELGQPERRRRHRQQFDGRSLFRLRRLPHPVPCRARLLPQWREPRQNVRWAHLDLLQLEVDRHLRERDLRRLYDDGHGSDRDAGRLRGRDGVHRSRRRRRDGRERQPACATSAT